MESLSRRFARWVAGLQYETLPPEVLDRARGVTLQGLTSALVGHDLPDARQALRLMEGEEPGVSTGATVLVDGRQFTRAGAAFVNAEMMFCGGKWDTFRMLTHPGCAILPAALAAAEATSCPGSTYLVAVAAAYEVMERLASDFVPTLMSRGFHAGPVFGIFGAALAAAKIFGLDEQQTHGAISQCVNLAAGNLEGTRSGGRGVREGAAVRNALLAVALARQGIAGGETVLEGPAGFFHSYAGRNDGVLAYSFTGDTQVELGMISDGLGTRWTMLETLYRIYSTAGYNNPHVEVTAALCARDDIHPGQVDRIECVVNWLETQYPSPSFPSERTDAGPSKARPHYYAAYAVFARGFPVAKDVQNGIGEPDPDGLAEMMAKVSLVPSHTRPLFAPRVTIFTRDGVAHCMEGTGRELIMDFDSLAARLDPVGEIVPIGMTRYRALVEACRQVDGAETLHALIAGTCKR